MTPTRTEALTAVLDDISAFEIRLDQYYEDLEPQGFIDIFLTGKINPDSTNALHLICLASLLMHKLDERI